MRVVPARAIAAVFALVGTVLSGSAAPALSSTCPGHFTSGEAPVLTNPKLTPRTQTICYSGYAVLFSGLTRTPLWSAEHLTAERVQNARGEDRVNAFHPDPSLPLGERSELSDYVRSGFDRGHMAPSGDMPSPQSQEESFSLANMVPQDPDNNRHLWASVESAVRDLAVSDGELYVVTGPIFSGENVQSLKGRVLIPTQIYKAVYDPSRRGAAAYLVQNAPGQDMRIVSVSELQRITGIDPFPALPQTVKDRAMEMPEPHQRRRRPAPVAKAPPAIDLARRRLFVAELGNGTLDVVDLTTGSVSHRIAGLHEPQGVGYDPSGDVLAVASAADSSVRLYKGDSLDPISTVSLGGDADNIRLEPRTHRFIVGFGRGGLAIIDPGSRAVESTTELPAHPEGFQISPTETRAYVNIPDADQIAVVDLAAGKQIANWHVPNARSGFPMAVDPEGKLVAVVFRSPARLVALDASTGAVVASLPACRDADGCSSHGNRASGRSMPITNSPSRSGRGSRPGVHGADLLGATSGDQLALQLEREHALTAPRVCVDGQRISSSASAIVLAVRAAHAGVLCGRAREPARLVTLRPAPSILKTAPSAMSSVNAERRGIATATAPLACQRSSLQVSLGALSPFFEPTINHRQAGPGWRSHWDRNRGWRRHNRSPALSSCSAGRP